LACSSPFFSLADFAHFLWINCVLDFCSLNQTPPTVYTYINYSVPYVNEVMGRSRKMRVIIWIPIHQNGIKMLRLLLTIWHKSRMRSEVVQCFVMQVRRCWIKRVVGFPEEHKDQFVLF
jgi:hypothetical protein